MHKLFIFSFILMFSLSGVGVSLAEETAATPAVEDGEEKKTYKCLDTGPLDTAQKEEAYYNEMKRQQGDEAAAYCVELCKEDGCEKAGDSQGLDECALDESKCAGAEEETPAETPPGEPTAEETPAETPPGEPTAEETPATGEDREAFDPEKGQLPTACVNGSGTAITCSNPTQPVNQTGTESNETDTSIETPAEPGKPNWAPPVPGFDPDNFQTDGGSPNSRAFDPHNRNGRGHTGIDIGGAVGTPVQSVMEGEVILSQNVSGYGNTVVVKHPDGSSTLYAHNQANNVRVGDQVTAGQQIASLGYSGNAGPEFPHVHFQYHPNANAAATLGYNKGKLLTDIKSNGVAAADPITFLRGLQTGSTAAPSNPAVVTTQNTATQRTAGPTLPAIIQGFTQAPTNQGNGLVNNPLGTLGNLGSSLGSLMSGLIPGSSPSSGSAQNANNYGDTNSRALIPGLTPTTFNPVELGENYQKQSEEAVKQQQISQRLQALVDIQLTQLQDLNRTDPTNEQLLVLLRQHLHQLNQFYEQYPEADPNFIKTFETQIESQIEKFER